jgi:hypothetical protein
MNHPPPKSGPVPKIPPKLHALVMAKAGDGFTSEEIAAFLWREHKLEVASRTVRQLVRRQRTELADAAKGVVREEIRKRLIPALRRAARGGIKANEIEKRLSRQAKAARDDGNEADGATLDVLTLKAIDREVKVADLLMHYAGLDQPDEVPKQSSAERRAKLLKRLEELTKPAQLPTAGVDPQVH